MNYKYPIILIILLLLSAGCKKQEEQKQVEQKQVDQEEEIKKEVTEEKVKEEEDVNISYGIDQLKNMEIADVSPNTVKDGEYTGKVLFMKKYLYHVKVTVKSGKIEDVQVIENGTGNKYAKKAFKHFQSGQI